MSDYLDGHAQATAVLKPMIDALRKEVAATTGALRAVATERDELKANLAEVVAMLTRMVANTRSEAIDPIYEPIAARNREGLGALMHACSRTWRRLTGSGAFTVGPCLGTVEVFLETARVALGVERTT